MKKRLSIFTALILTTLISACGINGKEIFYIQSYEWKMQAVMSNDIEDANNEDALVIAVGEEDELYPNAKIVDLTLTASDGKISLVDVTNNKTYSGTYKILEETSKEIQYEVIIDGITGYATVSATEHYSGTKIPTLPINMGDYSLYFTPTETDMK